MSSVRISLVAAAVAGVVGLLATRRFKVGGRTEEDLTPTRLWKEPAVAIPFEQSRGPVLVTVEYRIDPEQAAEFNAIMRESRRVWLQNGLLAWELFRDTADPGRYIEYFVDESWVEYRRRNDRVTAYHVALREKKTAMHIGENPPRGVPLHRGTGHARLTQQFRGGSVKARDFAAALRKEVEQWSEHCMSSLVTGATTAAA